ncbi:uncharacterized protein LOC129717397 [Wyeomyia smithii]|uniref:uncharacterized protein LOC129717397 n=1 Tax=Wyeomyia smithii TaxID=174621 RepID=UPI002467AFFB|nr:uncharacterized protein LOC129717397 [Wyeomyia smithii]
MKQFAFDGAEHTFLFLLFWLNFIANMSNGDHFVVVQTTEAGAPLLSVVPHQWVRGNVLLWPTKNANSLCKDASSKPAASWSKLPCVVKRKHIATYAAAEQQAADLSGMSTDVSDFAPRKKTKKNPRIHFLQSQQPTAEQYLNAFNSGKENVTFSPNVISQPFAMHHRQPLQNVLQVLDNDTVSQSLQPSQIPSLNSEKIVQDISKKIEEQCAKTKTEIVNTIEVLLARTVAALKSDFDVKIAAAFRSQANNIVDNQNFTFSPAASIEDIKQLEKNLTDETYTDKLMVFMHKVIGHTGDNCNGQNMCYALVDQFFERNVMLNCSWSGGSKSNIPKFAMKDCKNILCVFFRIVHNVNPTFSKKLLENFFKQVLRNSKTRSQAKGLRQPTIHRRGKQKAKKCDKETNNINNSLTEILKIENHVLNLNEIEEEDGVQEYDKNNPLEEYEKEEICENIGEDVDTDDADDEDGDEIGTEDEDSNEVEDKQEDNLAIYKNEIVM